MLRLIACLTKHVAPDGASNKTYIPNCIPLCLNRKFQNPYRHATHMTPTSNSKLLKLQLEVIGISDIEWVKRKVPVLDSLQFLKVEKLKNSLSKNDRFRTFGSTFCSRRTQGRFASGRTENLRHFSLMNMQNLSISLDILQFLNLT